MRRAIICGAVLAALAACGGAKIGPNHSANVFPRAEFIAYVPTFGTDHTDARKKLMALAAKHCGIPGSEAETRLVTYGPFSWQRKWGMPAACGEAAGKAAQDMTTFHR